MCAASLVLVSLSLFGAHFWDLYLQSKTLKVRKELKFGRR